MAPDAMGSPGRWSGRDGGGGARKRCAARRRGLRRALARGLGLQLTLALVRRRVTEVVEGFYDIGEALREILDHKLYAAAGHASLEALRAILREAGISRAAITAGRGDVRIVVSRAAVERAARGR